MTAEVPNILFCRRQYLKDGNLHIKEEVSACRTSGDDQAGQYDGYRQSAEMNTKALRRRRKRLEQRRWADRSPFTLEELCRAMWH
jgi:hypothetical protein